MSVIRGGQQEGWERSDFPIVCETCLGPNPYLRMTKAEFDKECKICARPFTVFRWRPGTDARYKKTEVCQTCAKVKNVCQTCLLDLEFGLPVQVREAATAGASGTSIPQSDINREWFINQAERQLANGYATTQGKQEARAQLQKFARSQPYFKRNQAHICSFFVKGQCTRGDSCPYRHEMPEENDLSKQNLKDRYYGVNDPVAKKILGKFGASTLTPPSDPEIKTLWVGGVEEKITEDDLRDVFYAYGELKEIKVVPQSKCAFVTYTTREAAELAASKLYLSLMVRDVVLKLAWGKPDKPKKPQQPQTNTFFTLPGANPIPTFVPPPNPTIAKPYYPSMDQTAFGAKRDR